MRDWMARSLPFRNRKAYGGGGIPRRRGAVSYLCRGGESGSGACGSGNGSPRLVLKWRGSEIVNISRAFLDTNGAHQETDVFVEMPDENNNYFLKIANPVVAQAVSRGDVRTAWLALLGDLNVCSQKGLVEMFDASIGAGSVFMPYGGKYQLTETQAMVAKLPTLTGKTDTVTMMSYGFDPYLSTWSPYHGAVYAVTESMAKIVANGGDYKTIRFTFQEYFRRMSEEPSRWSQPFAALLGAYDAQMKYGLPSIGGKDSMSGTFNDIDVPPTLVSFAVDVNKSGNIVSPELKYPGDRLVRFCIPKDEYDLPDYDGVMTLYDTIMTLMSEYTDKVVMSGISAETKKRKIVAAYALDAKGVAAAISKMAFGNGLGVAVDSSYKKDRLFDKGIGDIVAEMPAGEVHALKGLGIDYEEIGTVTADGVFSYGSMKLSGRMRDGRGAVRSTECSPTRQGGIRVLLRCRFIRRRKCMCADIRSRSPRCLFRSSRHKLRV